MIITGGEPDFTPYELFRKREPGIEETDVEARIREAEEKALDAVNKLIRRGVLSGSELPLPDADRE